MLTLIVKDIAKNSMYTVQRLHLFQNHLELDHKSFYFDVIPSHQYFHYIL